MSARPGGASAQVVKEVTVPAYGSLSMDPKGLHMVLSGLKRPLKDGDTISLTLTLHEGSKMEVSAAVKKESVSLTSSSRAPGRSARHVAPATNWPPRPPRGARQRPSRA